MTSAHPFLNPYSHGFVRVAVGVPRLRVADPAFNTAETIRLFELAVADGATVVAFPELGLSSYTCDDLFRQFALLDACEGGLMAVAEATRRLPAVAIVGLPVRANHQLFNCAAVVHGGRVLGIVPKTFLPNYGEFYEPRQFNAADSATVDHVTIGGQTIPFGADLLFDALNVPHLALHCEICEDLWVPVPPSSFAALAGATVLVNLSASNITVGKSDYRHRLVGVQSGRCLAAYLYSSAGLGESTTDMGWDGEALIYENGDLLADSARFLEASHFISADVDLERLDSDRMRQNSFGESARNFQQQVRRFRRIGFELTLPEAPPGPLRRSLERFPFVPDDPATRDARCHEVYNIQVNALLQRLAATGIRKLVIGVSGGLDSAHALLVCAKAMDRLGKPRSDIMAYTMPGFATSTRTLDQARRLMAAVGCTAHEIDIRPSCLRMLADIGHSHTESTPHYDVVFENVQAGERTSHLFRLANLHNGIVVGTGDLSELALGWCTYGVGDHMSHYNVNASVPKTLIKHLIRWVAQAEPEMNQGNVLIEVLETEVSPELVPASATTKQLQSSEASVGPYELQDFHLYYVLRYGFAPTKVAFLAHAAWSDANAGRWPAGIGEHNAYTLAEIKKHLRNFVWRFFKTSQFKRSAVPNSPKIGSGGSLSPRGDWRAPSDSEATAWLASVDRIPDLTE